MGRTKPTRGTEHNADEVEARRNPCSIVGSCVCVLHPVAGAEEEEASRRHRLPINPALKATDKLEKEKKEKTEILSRKEKRFGGSPA